MVAVGRVNAETRTSEQWRRRGMGKDQVIIARRVKYPQDYQDYRSVRREWRLCGSEEKAPGYCSNQIHDVPLEY